MISLYIRGENEGAKEKEDRVKAKRQRKRQNTEEEKTIFRESDRDSKNI